MLATSAGQNSARGLERVGADAPIGCAPRPRYYQTIPTGRRRSVCATLAGSPRSPATARATWSCNGVSIGTWQYDLSERGGASTNSSLAASCHPISRSNQERSVSRSTTSSSIVGGCTSSPSAWRASDSCTSRATSFCASASMRISLSSESISSHSRAPSMASGSSRRSAS